MLQWFAEAYGWTPRQVAELPVEYAEWFHVVEAARAKVARMKQDKKI